MPPRGVKKGTKRARQYEHIKQSERERGISEPRAEEIAARTVNKSRARSGESRARSRTSVSDISSGRRGGLRSGKPGSRGRTREQLYEEARRMGVQGRSRMNKHQLQRAVDAKRASAPSWRRARRPQPRRAGPGAVRPLARRKAPGRLAGPRPPRSATEPCAPARAFHRGHSGPARGHIWFTSYQTATGEPCGPWAQTAGQRHRDVAVVAYLAR